MAIAIDPNALKKPLINVGVNNPLQMPGVGPQAGDGSQDPGMPLGGYNNPANAPQNPADTSIPGGPNDLKAQGGTGPASNTTPTDPSQLPNVGSQTYQQPTDIKPGDPQPLQPGPLPVTPEPPGPPQFKMPEDIVQPPGPPQIATETMRPDQPEDLWGGHDQQQVGPPQIANETGMVGDAPPQMPIVGTTPFGPGNDLRYQAVQPDTPFKSVATDVAQGPAVDPTVSPELAKYRALQSGAADTLSTGPTRGEIAQKQLDAFDLKAQPGIRDGIRAVGQRAAALGRIGNGQTAIEALTPYTDYLNNRAALSNELSASTATGEIADRQAKLAAANGLVDQTAGLDASVRGEQRTERANTQDTAAQNIARQIAERNAGVTNAASNRAETRGERTYQQQISDKAIQDAINQHLLEGGDQQTGFNQNLALLQTANANNPANAYLDASGQAANASGQSAQSLAELMRQFYASQPRAA